ncbi:MAG: long-chain fatty acid--CoA ligase [Bacteroidales bacterium]|nr:long-chain fatty acid--CoA ligase [Bacteroidales bacterium]
MFNNAHLSVLIEQQARRYGDKTALSYRDYERGEWVPVSWNAFADTVQKVSRALLAFGVARGERIAIFSQNKPECLYTAFGAYGIRAVVTPFYPTSSGAQVTYMMNDAEVRFLFVGEQQQYDTAFSVLSLCHSLERIVIFDKTVKRKETDHFSIYFDDFLRMGEENRTERDSEIARRKGEATFDDMADILYTSGTTGNSKGVIMTYTMYHAAFEGNDATLPVSEEDVVLNFLPFTHVFERGWAYLCLTEGAQLAINLRPLDVQRSMQEVRPTCMASVPRFWEKVYQGVQEKIATSPLMQRKLMQAALDTGIRYWEHYGSKCLPAPPALALKYKLYDKTIYRLLRKTLGLDRANFFPTAGAAVSPEVEKFVHAVGIYMMVGYGLTESTATVSNDHKEEPCTLGSIGRPIPGLEVRIGEENEILLRGKTITPGYYKKETSTKAVFDEEGWFHTGDAGYIKDGELYLTERLKDLFKTSNGKYIAPQMIESKLTIDRYMEQCVVIADKRKFVTALIVPNYDLLERFAAEKDINYGSREELCRHPQVTAMLKERIDTLQQDLATYEKVKYFLLLPEPFTMENGEITNTLKVKRNVVCKRYAAEIDKMYADAEQQFSAK